MAATTRRLAALLVGCGLLLSGAGPVAGSPPGAPAAAAHQPAQPQLDHLIYLPIFNDVLSPLAQVVFDWDDVPGATGYRVQVSASSSFDTLLLDQPVTPSTYTWASTLTGPHFWRTQTMTASGNGPFSATRAIQLVSYAGDDDGDSLPNGWELHGYDADLNGSVDIDLPGLGASYLHKDLFVEMDYMVNNTVTNGIGPNVNVMTGIVDAYQAMPVPNPDGVPGINIHLDLDDEVPFDPDLSPLHSEFYALKNTYFTPGRIAVYHYMVWANAYAGGSSSGYSMSIPASDFIVTVGWLWHGGEGGLDTEKIGTFVHELGHNLGLFHGGNDDVNYKPNYLSVMNYRFQFSGVYRNGDWHYEYQSIDLPSLNENSLSEAAGLGGGGPLAEYGTIHTCPPPSYFWQYTNAAGAIDWNCDLDTVDVVAADVNGDSFRSLLGTQNNIANLNFNGGGVIGAGQSPQVLANRVLAQPQPALAPEMTYEDLLALQAHFGPGAPVPAP